MNVIRPREIKSQLKTTAIKVAEPRFEKQVRLQKGETGLGLGPSDFKPVLCLIVVSF